MILRYLQSNGQHAQVCHGDFHPGNIIIDAQNGLCTIDWMNSYYGNPVGDVVRSYITLMSPYIPFKAPGIIRLMFLLYKRFLGSLYLHEYRKDTAITRNDINTWIPIIAAVRLADNVPHEGEWLATLIEKKRKHLAKACP
jgi:thiamine kinase-like enzyme